MKNKNKNVFTISTPSQMINAMEFIHYYKIKDENNIILISSSSTTIKDQIVKVGSGFDLIFHELFQPKFLIFNDSAYNKMPLKLRRLFISRYAIKRILINQKIDKLILGNYSNFISQYCTQIINTETFVLDDGTGSITRASKRERELNEEIPFFELNRKKGALRLVKLIMGFYNYNIPKKLIFFSSYTFHLAGRDEIVHNDFSFIKRLYSNQKKDNNLIYFIGSPISEVGYITLENEINIILSMLSKFKGNKVIYIPHRLDSNTKLKRIKENIDILSFDLPIEFALTQITALPYQIVGFFSSALFNLMDMVQKDISFYSVKIPNDWYLRENLRSRALQVYNELAHTNRIVVEEYQDED